MAFTLRTFPMKKVWSLSILFFWQEIKHHIQSSKEKQGLRSSPHITAKVNSAKYNWDSVARPRILLKESLNERNLTVSILLGDYIWKEMQTARGASLNRGGLDHTLEMTLRGSWEIALLSGIGTCFLTWALRSCSMPNSHRSVFKNQKRTALQNRSSELVFRFKSDTFQ